MQAGDSVTDLSIELHDLRRIVRQKEDGDANPLYTVLFMSNSGELTKIVDAVFADNQTLPVEIGQSGAQPYQVDQIEDFVSCSFDKHCQ